jgi:hypothetical protein
VPAGVAKAIFQVTGWLGVILTIEQAQNRFAQRLYPIILNLEPDTIFARALTCADEADWVPKCKNVVGVTHRLTWRCRVCLLESPPDATAKRDDRRLAVPASDGNIDLGARMRGSCRLAVSEVRLALPNFYNITIRIANVAARLAVLVLWLCDKLGSSISP